MSDKNKDLRLVKQLLDTAEGHIRQAKNFLFTSEINKKAAILGEAADGSVIEGVFDGENMIASDNKKYPIPPNYASKSKLIPGDVLKLTILSDGTFIYKQIGPIKRKKIVGLLEEIEPGKYVVRVDSKIYRVLTASITYFKAESGNRLTIIVPQEGESEWAAVENIIKSNL